MSLINGFSAIQIRRNLWPNPLSSKMRLLATLDRDFEAGSAILDGKIRSQCFERAGFDDLEGEGQEGAGAGRGQAAHSQMYDRKLPSYKGVVTQAVGGAKTPAVTLTLKGVRGPLYVNTTSAGPRGNSRLEGERHDNVDPGYAQISLSNDGTIQRVEFRQLGEIDPAVQRARLSQEPAILTGFATTGSPG